MSSAAIPRRRACPPEIPPSSGLPMMTSAADYSPVSPPPPSHPSRPGCMYAHRQVQLGHHLIHPPRHLRRGGPVGQPEAGEEGERLLDGEHPQERVVLGGVTAQPLEVGRPWAAVHHDAPAQARVPSHGEAVQQRALPAAGWAHNRHHLPRGAAARDAVEQPERLLLVRHDVVGHVRPAQLQLLPPPGRPPGLHVQHRHDRRSRGGAPPVAVPPVPAGRRPASPPNPTP